jgi:hypothetical protein
MIGKSEVGDSLIVLGLASIVTIAIAASTRESSSTLVEGFR